MRIFRRMTLVFLLISAALILGACGKSIGLKSMPTPSSPSPADAALTAAPAPEETPSLLEKNAGKYSFHCAYMSPEYVDKMYSEYGVRANRVETCYVLPDTMLDYTVTLNADGTGSLYWGADNRGPIDRWETDGEKLQFLAGKAAFDGFLVDGYMSVESEPGFVLYFAAPGAKLPDVTLLKMDEYINLLYARQTPTEENMAGLYYCYAMENGEYRVRMDDFAQSAEGSVTLNADGTGVMITGGIGNAFTWRLEDGKMHWSDETGERSMDGMLNFRILREGVFTLRYTGQDYVTYYVREGADVSDIETISVEEYQALVGEG